MAFFDELGAKITKAGQIAMQKTNEMADTASLNMRTSELNRANQALYAKLGEAYYQAHGQFPEEDLAQLCGEIAKNLEELAKIRLDIQRIKQIKVCPQCGCENPASANFCSSCSAALPELPPKEQAPAEVVCPNCGVSVKEGATFCTNCGSRLDNPQ